MARHPVRALPRHKGNITSVVRPAMGYVAPVFQDKASYHAGRAPIAWAVKAGQPVARKPCRHTHGICGMFAAPLRRMWLNFHAPPHFGATWGFNITRFSREEMLEAAAVVQHYAGESREEAWRKEWGIRGELPAWTTVPP